MACFSALSLIYILQRRYYGAINSNLDKIGRLFINITFSVVWIKVVVYKGYLSHQELCQRKELEGYWCPVMRRNYECSPSDDLHGTQKMWWGYVESDEELCQRKELEGYWCPVMRRNYECSPSDDLHGTQKMWWGYVESDEVHTHCRILSSSIISCASEFFPVLLVAHWLACGGAEEKAEDIERRRQKKPARPNYVAVYFVHKRTSCKQSIRAKIWFQKSYTKS
ncbi:unnamed protein product [Strongylus vulgaris]|uniref:Uncharacterized protein n=1 Tax=Strongylus vulgaris TaxID=40348 RepID=A0A3P7LNW5_STRVU|nr:unnamed protein product [Strongylus vulgaris]